MSQSNWATFCFLLTNHERTAKTLEVQLLFRYFAFSILKFYSVTFKVSMFTVQFSIG